MEQLFCRVAHHGAGGAGISCFLITQDLFYSPAIKVCRRNANFYALFASPGDKSWIAELGRRMYPNAKQFLTMAYNDSVKSQRINGKDYHHCLVINLTVGCEEQLRVTSTEYYVNKGEVKQRMICYLPPQ